MDLSLPFSVFVVCDVSGPAESKFSHVVRRADEQASTPTSVDLIGFISGFSSGTVE